MVFILYALLPNMNREVFVIFTKFLFWIYMYMFKLTQMKLNVLMKGCFGVGYI